MDKMMASEQIKNLITDKISGEWGEEAILGEGVRIIRTANFTNLGVINYDKVVYRNVDEKKVNQKKLKKGDIIIEKSGGSPNQPVGRVVYFDLDTQENYLCNNFTTILRPDRNKVHPKYLFYQLFIGHIKGKTLKYQNKTTGIINLKLDSYLNERIDISPIEDQIRIAIILSKAEALIKQRKESIALLDEFLKSTFLEMFGDFGKNTSYKKELLGNNISFLTSGSRGWAKYYSTSGVKFLRIQNIGGGTIRTDNLIYVNPPKSAESKRTIVEEGDLIISITADLGRASVVPKNFGEAYISQHLALIRLNKNVNPIYAAYFYNMPYGNNSIQKKNRSAVKAGLNFNDVKSFPIIIPDLKKQNEFAQIVEKTEVLKNQYQASLGELEQLFGSLSQKAFKGELDLSQVKEEEENFEEGFVSVDEAEPIIKVLQNDALVYLNSLPPIKSKDPKLIKEIRDLDFLKRQEGNIKFNENYAKYRILAPHFETEILVNREDKPNRTRSAKHKSNKHLEPDLRGTRKAFLRPISKTNYQRIIIKKVERPRTFNEIYKYLEGFKDITYEQVRDFVFKGLTDEKPFFEQVFDSETKEIRHKLLL